MLSTLKYATTGRYEFGCFKLKQFKFKKCYMSVNYFFKSIGFVENFATRRLLNQIPTL